MEENEIQPDEKNSIVPRELLVNQGTSAAIYLTGGIFLLIVTFGARFAVLGIVLSALALAAGMAALFSRNREDRKPGLVVGAAGVLGLIVRFGPPRLKPFAAFALGLGGLFLLAAGIGKGVIFLKGLKSRQ
jgi:hypothetical protein